jgi:hypothetical protein
MQISRLEDKRKQLIAEVDAQARKRAVAVSPDRWQAETQVGGHPLLRHALQQARAHIELTRCELAIDPFQPPCQLLQRACRAIQS